MGPQPSTFISKNYVIKSFQKQMRFMWGALHMALKMALKETTKKHL